MEYKDRAKTRKFKRQLIHFFDLIKLKGLNLSVPRKIILAGVTVGITSLFLNWIDSENELTGNILENNIEDIIVNSFSNLVGSTGITILVIQTLILFLIFSKKNKERIKLSTDLHIKDFTLIIIAGIFTIILSINALILVGGLNTFSYKIVFGKGIIAEICAGIIITVGGILLRNEFYMNKNQIYTNESEDENKIENNLDKNEENKMSLPF